MGGLLGILDGLSALASPEARPIIMTIVIGSTIKGLVTGVLAGLIANRWRSLGVGVTAGVVIGLVLSALAAMSQPDHYLEIVVPGMILGAIVGFVTQRYPRAGLASLIALVMTGVAVLAQQPSPPADPLQPLAFLIGKWEGTSQGQSGNGTVQRDYTRILNGRYIRVQNTSVYPPQEKNPKGETHEDIGVISFDKARRRAVLRQFHVEGFVNQYVAQIDGPAGPIVFVSEAIENIPAGFRARETYRQIGPDEFEEVFELAEPGKDFEVYSRSRLRRVR